MRSAASPPAPHQAADTSIPIARRHLAALDGVRFIAAFCVLAGHGYWYVVEQQVPSANPVAQVMKGLPGLGMTLFFVLSGFVIHFNYHKTVGVARGGTFDFFVARFSRLYPLFIAVFAIDFIQLFWIQGFASRHPRFDFDLFGPLPFFLSFTQSWLFIPFEGHPLYEHYATVTGQVGATGAMWSLSTEWLFYVVYPLLSAWLARRYGRGLAAFAALAAAGGLLYYTWWAYHIATLRFFALTHFHSQSLADSFIGWVVFYSPLGRISEFLLGAAAAQYYLTAPRPNGPLTQIPLTATAALTTAIVAWMIGTAIIIIPVSGVNASCAAIAVTLFVVLVARYETAISKFLGSSLLVKCGEASYSLYLLHFYTMHEWAAPYAVGFSTFGRVCVFLIGMLASIAIARVVYLLYELPSLRWLRRNLKPLRLHLVIGAVFVAITFFSSVAALQTLAVRRFCASTEQMNCSALGITPGPRAAH